VSPQRAEGKLQSDSSMVAMDTDMKVQAQNTNNIPSFAREVPDYVQTCRAALDVFMHDGLRLASYRWDPPSGTAPLGVVLLVHGIGSHCVIDFLSLVDYYDVPNSYGGAKFHKATYAGSFVEHLNHIGLVVFALDVRSFGLSEGPEGAFSFFENFDDCVNDFIAYRQFVSERFPSLPLFLVGLSMGGCIATRMVQEDDFSYAGLVTLAPMLSLEKIKKRLVNRILFPVSELGSKLIPKWRLAEKSSHPQKVMQDAIKAHELFDNELKVRVRVAVECLHAVDIAREKLEKVSCPVFSIHSRFDGMTDLAGSELLIDKASSQDKTLQVLEDERTWHVLIQEPGKAKVFEMVSSWIRPRAQQTVTQA